MNIIGYVLKSKNGKYIGLDDESPFTYEASCLTNIRDGIFLTKVSAEKQCNDELTSQEFGPCTVHAIHLE